MTSFSFHAGWDIPFHSSPFRLRFELGGEVHGIEAPVPRFVQAFTRAQQIVSRVFQSSQNIFGIVGSWKDAASDNHLHEEGGFRTLAEAGFASRALSEWTAPLLPDEDEAAMAIWRVFDVSREPTSRDVLIWCSISNEMAVTPKSPVLSYLVDPDRNILVHIYDDRGMDVTSLEREALIGLYQKCNDWLLDYDRTRIDETFGSYSINGKG